MSKAAARKEESHERIVRAAARALRRDGYEGLGVAGVMKEAGLTHGGFYAHFASRNTLLAEAADLAGVESVEAISKAVRDAPAGEGLKVLLDHYLSDRHVSANDSGCSLAMAGSELPRQAAEVRHAATRRIRDLINLVETQVGWRAGSSRDKAMAALSCMVGALMLARAVDDPELSRALRDAARRAVTGG